MSAQRPNAVVYQEYATITVTPDIPDLNVLIAGPSMQLLDYLDDKDDCYATDYGAYQENNPAPDPTAVVVASPPNIVAGGVLDGDSVLLYFDDAQVVITEPIVPIPAAFSAIYTAGSNLFEAHTNSGGAHFGSAGVIPGDTLLVQSPVGPTGDDYVMTVKEITYTLVDYGAALDFMSVTNPVQPGDLVILTNDTAGNPRNGTWTVKRVVDAHTLEIVETTWKGNTELPGTPVADITVTDPTGAPRIPLTLAVGLSDYSNIRTTSDFVGTETGVNNRPWRVERKVDGILLDDADFSVSGNSVTINGAITVSLSALLSSQRVTYAKAYMEYAAFRTDLQVLTTLSNYTEIEEKLGKYDARNPLMVGAVVAKANTSTPIKIYGVPDDTLTDYMEFRDRISVERDVYAIVPLTLNTSIINMLVDNCEQLASPDYALTQGVKQKFRVVIGSLELQTTKIMMNPVGGCSITTQPVTAPAGNKTGTLAIAGGPALTPDFFTCDGGDGIRPGDVFEIWDDSSVPGTPSLLASYTVAQTNNLPGPHLSNVFEADSAITTISRVAPGHVGDYCQFTRNGVVIAGTVCEIGIGPITGITLTASALDDLYLNLTAPSATFLTSGCVPGDILQIPENPTYPNWSGAIRYWVIDEVISNQKVRIKNSGNNTSTLENELPHGGRRTDGTEITTTLYCRVLRNLDKTQQVDEMVAVAQSINSKRGLLCFPDEVWVTSLVDGSLPRITDPDEPEPADEQPGYYLACAVGGQTAGQPPHQGFTNLGISGIDTIAHSVEYFTEELITRLSNGGVYVFVQDNPAALPYSVHEVTTDVSALEFSEYMVVKDFDFVAWTFLDTLLPFIGIWNVTDEAVEFIRQALFTTGDNLKARKVAKIGSPLLDYALDSVGKSTLSKDRIETYMQVDLPMTLNTLALHLVA